MFLEFNKRNINNYENKKEEDDDDDDIYNFKCLNDNGERLMVSSLISTNNNNSEKKLIPNDVNNYLRRHQMLMTATPTKNQFNINHLTSNVNNYSQKYTNPLQRPSYILDNHVSSGNLFKPPFFLSSILIQSKEL